MPWSELLPIAQALERLAVVVEDNPVIRSVINKVDPKTLDKRKDVGACLVRTGSLILELGKKVRGREPIQYPRRTARRKGTKP